MRREIARFSLVKISQTNQKENPSTAMVKGFSLFLIGGDERDRTVDLLNAIQERGPVDKGKFGFVCIVRVFNIFYHPSPPSLIHITSPRDAVAPLRFAQNRKRLSALSCCTGFFEICSRTHRTLLFLEQQIVRHVENPEQQEKGHPRKFLFRPNVALTVDTVLHNFTSMAYPFRHTPRIFLQKKPPPARRERNGLIRRVSMARYATVYT